ncbi:hypothetical protein C1646_663885 [Rhizophagus diaphanus]|nr:hypothetical protein C1646_663885 [Rhizophagus diaphanus] [Rhizophagus sp. MUCL 43196]
MEDSLQGVLRDFYNKLNITEKLLLYTCITDLAGYTFLLMAFLILSGKFLINFVAILLIFFPIISGITMDNVCSDIPKDCIFPKGSIYYISAVFLLSFLLIVTAFYCLILYNLWARKNGFCVSITVSYFSCQDNDDKFMVNFLYNSNLGCQGNFKKGLGFYLRYEPTPDEFKVENTFKKRESTPADFNL